LTFIINIGILVYMKNKNGQPKEIKRRRDGKPLMVPRIIFLEPALWDLYDRLAKTNHTTRSTFLRKDIKDHRRLEKMPGVDWAETNIKPN
jgi:hypothetical protein